MNYLSNENGLKTFIISQIVNFMIESVFHLYILPYLTGATRLNIDFRKYTLKTLSSTPGAYGANIIYVLQNGIFFLIEI